MTDIKSHIEAIRSIFKKRFSGEFSYFNGSKSPDIFRGKDDLEENFDWKNYSDELDKFDDEIYEYIDEKKLNGHTVEEILKNFESTGKNFDKKIAWEILLIKKLHGNKIPKLSETWDGINEKTFRDRGSGFDYYPINCRRTCTRLVPREIKLIFCCVFNNLKHNIHVNIN